MVAALTLSVPATADGQRGWLTATERTLGDRLHNIRQTDRREGAGRLKARIKHRARSIQLLARADGWTSHHRGYRFRTLRLVYFAKGWPAKGCGQGGTVTANLSLGQCMAKAVRWTGDQWDCLRTLGHRESGWWHLATNPTSGAFGIPQSLPANKLASAGSPITSPVVQIRWMLSYIRGRYGTPCAALAFHTAHGWY